MWVFTEMGVSGDDWKKIHAVPLPTSKWKGPLSLSGQRRCDIIQNTCWLVHGRAREGVHWDGQWLLVSMHRGIYIYIYIYIPMWTKKM